jgi:hypothetical protein
MLVVLTVILYTLVRIMGYWRDRRHAGAVSLEVEIFSKIGIIID